MHNRLAPVLLAALTGVVACPPASPASEAIAEYTAEYEVRYKGRRVARSEFSVAAAGADEYLFTSSTRARGLLRLAAPNAAIERSRFVVADGSVRPLEFNYEDGSRKGEDNYAVDFDADAGRGEVRLTGPAGDSTFPYAHGLLDRGSLQVALMRDLAACRLPGPYAYVDDGGIRTYEYARLDDQATETGIGTLATVRFEQQRAGSSRRTILWLAPALAFLPVRIEQVRDGETEAVFTLEEVSGLASSASACSGFR
jgi:hypothetical protein